MVLIAPEAFQGEPATDEEDFLVRETESAETTSANMMSPNIDFDIDDAFGFGARIPDIVTLAAVGPVPGENLANLAENTNPTTTQET